MADRGVLLDSLDAVLRARGTVGDWEEFIAATRLSAGTREGGKREDIAYFYALPADPESPLYVYGDLRRENDETLLHLRWELMPEGEPPEYIRTASQRVEGWPKVLQRIAASWPGPKDTRLDATATYVIDTTVHRLPSSIELNPTPSTVLVHQLTQTATAWRIDPPSGPVHRLSVATLRPNQLVVVASGSVTLTLSPDLAEELRRVMWGGLKPFLRKL